MYVISVECAVVLVVVALHLNDAECAPSPKSPLLLNVPAAFGKKGMSRPASSAATRPASAASRPRSASKLPPGGCCYPLSRFLRPPAPRHRCPVDGGVHRDAVVSRVCGHTFGLQCAIYHSIEQDKCPVCFASMDASDLEPAEAVRSEINALQIHCAEGYESCSWVGHVRDEATHRNGPYCAVQRIDCPFCDVKGLLVGAAFEAHKETCQECVVICPQCCEDMPRRLLESHMRDACKAEAIEPLRRQQENLSRPVSTCATPTSFPVGASSVGVEPIDRDDEDAPSPTPAAPQKLDETACGDAAQVASETVCPEPSKVRAPSNDDFSPPPPRRTNHEATPTIGNPTTAKDAPTAEEPMLDCPMAAMGCDARHTLRDLTSPHVMQHHLNVLSTAYCSLRNAHTNLLAKVDVLATTVDQQRKTIKLLDVRSALQSGKLNISSANGAGSKSTSGLVDSPRVATSGAAPAAAAGEVPPTSTTTAEATATPQRMAQETSSTAAASSAKKRSVSSPAAPNRQVHPAGPVDRTAVPLFVPSMPKKKQHPSAGANVSTAAPPRRPVAAPAADAKSSTKQAAA